jgi:hypothetical protein
MRRVLRATNPEPNKRTFLVFYESIDRRFPLIMLTEVPWLEEIEEDGRIRGLRKCFKLLM